MKKDATTAAASPYGVWDRVKVSKEFFDLLIQHPVFQAEPKAINTAQYWLREIDATMERNDGRPVTWDYKDIQDRFRAYSQSHTEFRDALRNLGLITFTTYKPPPNAFDKGECRRFEITANGRRLIADTNHQWLYNLLKDPETRRRNQVAVSKRKGTRKLYTDPISRIIDEFRHSVKFERDGLLNQLRRDHAEAPGRYGSALVHLLALERRAFCELEVKEGRIYHEFANLPSAYRPFALVNGKPYLATVDIRACHPAFLARVLADFAKACIAETNGTVASPHGRPDRLQSATILSENMNLRTFAAECGRWTAIFTDAGTDPREAIMKEAGLTIDQRDMKQCLNTWLNGAKKYRRPTDGRWNMTNNKRLEAWFQERFPEMARVWAAMEQRQITGRLIMEEYEGALMLDPELYAFGGELGLTFAYEYDGVGVFAEREDTELPAKLEKVKAFIQRKSVEKFDVPVVVKVELVAQ